MREGLTERARTIHVPPLDEPRGGRRISVVVHPHALATIRIVRNFLVEWQCFASSHHHPNPNAVPWVVTHAFIPQKLS